MTKRVASWVLLFSRVAGLTVIVLYGIPWQRHMSRSDAAWTALVITTAVLNVSASLYAILVTGHAAKRHGAARTVVNLIMMAMTLAMAVVFTVAESVTGPGRQLLSTHLSYYSNLGRNQAHVASRAILLTVSYALVALSLTSAVLMHVVGRRRYDAGESAGLEHIEIDDEAPGGMHGTPYL